MVVTSSITLKSLLQMVVYLIFQLNKVRKSKTLIDTDEGAKHLGEVALVPHDSPISQSDVLFYNTLFDENASNHFALGSAYAFCIEGGKTMSREELENTD